MAERKITIHVKDGINLAKMMSAIFREYEPSIESIELKGVDTPLDHDIKTKFHRSNAVLKIQ